jgi:hypothetical protein
LTGRSLEEDSEGIVAIKHVTLVALGAVLGAAIMWAFVHPSPGESFPVVFRGTTNGVSGSGDAVAFYPNERYTEVFHAFPGFSVSGENRSDETLYDSCLAPHTAEQDVVFAVVNTGEYALAWYACLTEGIVRE